MAIADTWEIMPESMNSQRDELKEMFCELIDAMLPYQDKESGMWYQVINLGGIKPNYLETSGSAIFAYAIMKGVRLGLLDASYYSYGYRAFEGIARTIYLKKTVFCSSTIFASLQDSEILTCAKEHLSTICGNQS